jgi:small-conductance mechanosensitive channel
VRVATGSIVFGDMIYNAVSHAILKGRGLVAEGDWLEVPSLQINGAVQRIGPQLIEVQNWDNTLATVPPRYLLTNTFRKRKEMHSVNRTVKLKPPG